MGTNGLASILAGALGGLLDALVQDLVESVEGIASDVHIVLLERCLCLAPDEQHLALIGHEIPFLTSIRSLPGSPSEGFLIVATTMLASWNPALSSQRPESGPLGMKPATVQARGSNVTARRIATYGPDVKAVNSLASPEFYGYPPFPAHLDHHEICLPVEPSSGALECKYLAIRYLH